MSIPPTQLRGSCLAKFLHLLGRFLEVRAAIGWLNALKLFLGHRFCREYVLRLPFLRGPLYLRGNSSDAFVFRKVFLNGEYSVSLPSPRLIIDAGANIGMASVYFAAQFPDATILSVEPEATNVAQFRKNTAAYPNIRLAQGGLWSRSGYLAITNPDAEKVSFVLAEAAASGEDTMTAYSVTDLLAQAGHDEIDILKIDIEGSEAQVFAGDVDGWLSKVRLLLIELHESKAPGCGRVFFAATARHPFHYCQQGENVLLTRAPLAA